MTTIAEALNERKHMLSRTVEQAIREFEKETGFAVAGFDIQHLYTHEQICPIDVRITSVNLTIGQKE